VLDESAEFGRRCNPGLVELETMDAEDEAMVRDLIARHVRYTGSTYAAAILDRWSRLRTAFVKVMPRDFKRVLEANARTRRKVGKTPAAPARPPTRDRHAQCG
jgi:glutamate synthase domain-containing protein 3